LFLGVHVNLTGAQILWECLVREGVDIIPTITVVREWDRPRRVADTERGTEIRAEIGLLEGLVAAYRTNALRESPPPRGPS
jgi:fructose-1,6-bisphosphatase-3